MKRIGFTALLGILLVTAWLIAEKQAGPSERGRQYVCPMHPEYGSSLPGNCPVCGMQLVRSGGGDKGAALAPKVGERAPVAMGPEQQRSIGMALAEARIVGLGKTIHAAGRVSFAPPERMPSSEAGIVDQVFRMPSQTGALRLRAGEPILSLNGGIVAAPSALALLSVTPTGQHIEKGRDLFAYTSLAHLYVLADLRSADIAFLTTGQIARATLPAYPGKIWHGTVVETAPQFDERTQTLKVKLQFPNGEPEIWPGLLASVEIESRSTTALAVPESAVLTDGETSVVFVARSGDVFEPREIQTGVRAQSLVEVKRGLKPGERVVTAGTFLLDSESRLHSLGVPAGDRR